MPDLRYTLLADGSSDQALMPILTWLLREHGIESAIQPAWADLGRLRKPPRTLTERIMKALELHPCDLLFIHRDAEREPFDIRHAEIERALAEATRHLQHLPVAVCVVPVRMQEAWLLFDEQAIRMAASNPRGRQVLQLPRLADIERLPDPKEIMRQLIRDASGTKGRKLQRLELRPQRIADLIDDFSPLRSLPAFQLLEQELGSVITSQGWHSL